MVKTELSLGSGSRFNSSKEIVYNYFVLGSAFLISFLLTRLLIDMPLAAIVAVDLCFSAYFVYLFRRYHYSVLFWLHPFLLLIISLSVANNWFDNGDGVAHTQEAVRVIQTGLIARITQVSREYGTTNPLLISKVLSLGAVPGFAIPRILLEKAPQEAYIISQNLVILILLAAFLPLVRSWNVASEKILLIFALFLGLSPSLLVFTYAPHRHFVTQFSLVALFFGHLAISKRISWDRTAVYFLGITLVILSKPAYLLLYGFFFLVERFSNQLFEYKSVLVRNTRNLKIVSLILFVASSMYLYSDLQNFFLDAAEGIREQAKVVSSSVTYPGQNLPIISILYKYVFALLSPFPWYKYNFIIQVHFGGSWLHFFLHMLSAITGVYLFLAVILGWKRLKILDPVVRSSLLFGLCISLGVLGGATAFHNYITPSFVFLVPMLLYRSFRIPWTYPLLFILIMEFTTYVFQHARLFRY
ncbi:hypothetical protein [Cylindrospermopsis curvispora]|uniref:Uncharacterized protein n=1 Tax=Cylindrospermopsis curvispora GIHE-G1 TaxID=2666332 RepID=A0A7H0F1K3_9CYAN|nr:hypothetical protein [Cylindrospermopsis curvispora]QNP29919.1 hypothetical protein IAR63_02125 [Cylindrospermopsis curvispora GIHE-G1]